MQSGERMAIVSPESVSIEYELAGVGSRFIACFWDTLIQFVLMVMSGILLGFVSQWNLDFMRPGDINPLHSVAGALLILYFSLVFTGYYIFFETVWNGQTPGKRLAGLRVRRDGGYGIGFTEAVVRNLLRVIDFLPSSYAVGCVVMMMNARGKRIGDYVAGTVVVKERRKLREKRETVETPVAGVSSDPSLGAAVLRLSGQEVAVIREFLQRGPSLDPERADPIAFKLYDAFAGRIGLPARTGRFDTYRTLEAIVREYDRSRY